MSKLSFIMGSAFFIFITTLIINATEHSSEEMIDPITGELPETSAGIFDLLNTFWDILTFQVDGLPMIFGVIFSMISIGMGYIIALILKDLIPFT